MHIERVIRIEELRAYPVRAAKSASLIHGRHQIRRNRLTGLVVAPEALQQLRIAEEIFQHLRRHLDKIAFRRNAADPRPLLLATENRMHQVTELVEIRDNIGVLHQAGIDGIVIAARKITYKRSFRNLPSRNARHQRSGAEPLVLALARVHVEIETAHVTVAIEDIPRRYRRVPHLGIPSRTELYFEET